MQPIISMFSRWFFLMSFGLLTGWHCSVIAAEDPITRIAFGSCLQQDRAQPIWKAVEGFKPQLFLFAGDNVYGDSEVADLKALAQAYDRAAPRIADLRLGEIMATWDDHDFGRDDGGADYPYREHAKALFLDFWGVAQADPRRQREGVYVARTFGTGSDQLQVIMLDTRSFRSPIASVEVAPGEYLPVRESGATMLGQAQWTWLQHELSKPAKLRLIVSSVQVIAEDHRSERWAIFPNERQRLFGLLGERNGGGVLLISGDRHFGAIYRTTLPNGEKLLEVTASSLNLPVADEVESDRAQIGDAYGGENFGALRIDWATSSAELALRDLRGRIVVQQRLEWTR